MAMRQPILIQPTQLGPAAHASPLRLSIEPSPGVCSFVGDQWVRDTVVVPPDAAVPQELLFEKAGPRARLYFEPRKTRAAVVTCGGLCPGLNNVIRSLFLELHHNYGIAEVWGVRGGYLGLNPDGGQPPLRLTHEMVLDIHRDGGTILGSSRGEQPVSKMVDFLVERRIDILFCVGGDGTQRGASAICAEARRRNLPLAVVGIPKTIDCDIPYCDRTFGFLTAVEKATEVIHAAHTEAKGVSRGIGLVKLMGREAGFIACTATLVSQDVNFVLIPEVPFSLSGERGFLPALETRIADRDHAVVVVAEGAGQYLFPDSAAATDASGNRRYHDIGPHLKKEIQDYFVARGCPVEVKYLDPSYFIRSVPANCDDSLLSDRLARHAVHAAMSGRTDIVIGFRHGTFTHVPISMVVAAKRNVDPAGELWTAVLGATGQAHRFA